MPTLLETRTDSTLSPILYPATPLQQERRTYSVFKGLMDTFITVRVHAECRGTLW